MDTKLRDNLLRYARVEGAIVLVGAIAFVGYALTRQRSHVAPTDAPIEEEVVGENIADVRTMTDMTAWPTYEDAALGIAFRYPPRYHPVGDAFTSSDMRGVTLARSRDLPVGEATEGPPHISVLVVANPKRLTALEWVRANVGISNYSPDFFVDSHRYERIAGSAALRYHARGLGEFEYAILARGDRVVILTAFAYDEQDLLFADFTDLLTTLALTE